MIYPNLFFSFLFYPILFCPYFIQSYPILSHSFLFSSILSYSILFYPVLSYSVLILFYPILSRFTILSCAYHIISCTYPILSLSPIEHILCTALSHPVCPYPHLFRPDLTQLVLFYHIVSRPILNLYFWSFPYLPILSRPIDLIPISFYLVLIKQFINKQILKE